MTNNQIHNNSVHDNEANHEHLKVLPSHLLTCTHNHEPFRQTRQGFHLLDFYLPKHNIAIECQGVQHFEPTDFAKRGKKWAEKQFQTTIKRDKEKLEKCNNNNVKLLYYSNLNIKYPYKVFEDKELLIKEIRGTNG